MIFSESIIRVRFNAYSTLRGSVNTEIHTSTKTSPQNITLLKCYFKHIFIILAALKVAFYRFRNRVNRTRSLSFARAY